jgi:hypothetical protein
MIFDKILLQNDVIAINLIFGTEIVFKLKSVFLCV